MRKFQWLQDHLGAIVAALFICMILVAGVTLFHRHSNAQTLRVNGHTFSLEVASTAQEQSQGLGNRASLPDNEGMLFVFSGVPQTECFWMKDMSFPLDIVWIAADKQVVHIEQDVSPDTYPRSFCPSDPAQYVIELNAGAVASSGIRVGQTLNF